MTLIRHLCTLLRYHTPSTHYTCMHQAKRLLATSKPDIQQAQCTKPPTKRRAWSPSEDAKVLSEVGKAMSTFHDGNDGNKGKFYARRDVDWIKLSAELPGRSPIAIYTRFMTRSRGKTTPASEKRKYTRWNFDEDDALVTAVELYGHRKWAHVSRFVGTRTAIQCATRWARLGEPVVGCKALQTQWARDAYFKSKLKRVLRTDAVTPSLKLLSSIIGDSASSDAAASARNGAELDLGARACRPGHPPASAPDVPKARRRISYVSTFDSRKQERAEWCEAEKKRFDERVREAVARRNTTSDDGRMLSQGELSRIASAFPKRSYLDCAMHYRIHYRHTRVHMYWSKEEDVRLRDAVYDSMAKNGGSLVWAAIAEQMGTRSRAQCCTRWRQIIAPYIVATPFSEDDDRKLWDIVVDAGDDDKKAILKRVPAVRWVLCRTTRNILNRITRLKRVIRWLDVVAGVEAPHECLDLVHLLANLPSPFKIAIRQPAKLPTRDSTR